MSNEHHNILFCALRTLLRPLVRLLLANGITVQAMTELLKEVFVDVAMKEFTLPGKKQSQSRVSIITGLTRKEVQRLTSKNESQDENDAGEHHNRAAAVVAGWIRDTEFCNNNVPEVLPINGEVSSFSSLVKRFSGDMPVRGMLDELIRVGAVEKIDNDHVKLVSRSYIPATGDKEKIHMLGTDVADLVETISHNIQLDNKNADQTPRFQRKVMYDNLSEEAVQQFKLISSQRSQQVIEEFDRWLAKHDRDLNPGINGHGKLRAGVGIYYFEETLSQEKIHEQVS